MAKRKVKEVENVEETASVGVVRVSWKGKTRDYSEEVHGADFQKLASEFAEKVGGTVE